MEYPRNRPARVRSGIVSLLREHGITPTQQRVEIGQILFARDQHVSAELVLERARQGRSMVSKATVYNTLGLFADKGLIREVIVDPTKRFYDTNLVPHHHIYHTDTGMLEDVAAEDIRMESMPDLPQGTEVEGVDVVIRVRRAGR